MRVRTAFSWKLLVVFSALLLVLGSCKQDIDRKPFKVHEQTWYRIAPIPPVDVMVNGTAYVGTSFFPGGGTGNATHMGNIRNYFNQLVYSSSYEGAPLGSVAAPVRNIPSYPFLGPLPLIQPGDFTELAALNTSLQIPETIQGKIVNSVIYNKKGDAVFTSSITGIGGTFPISATRIGFNGKALIVGGRGKFANAVGEIDFQGSFSLTDPNDAEYSAEGWISY
jgi:hypothetical protein